MPTNRIIHEAPPILHRAAYRGDLRLNQIHSHIDAVIYIIAAATLLVGIVAWLGI